MERRSRPRPDKVVTSSVLALVASILLAGAGPARAADPQREWTSAPCLIETKLVYVATRVNGSAPRRFILASASPRSALDRAAAAALGIATGSATATDAPVTLAFAGLEVPVGHCPVVDLAWFAADEGVAIDGVLGCDVLRHAVVGIDYDAAVLRTAPPTVAPALDGAIALPVAIEDGVPVVTATLKVRGLGPSVRRYRVDTGSEGALVDDLFARARTRTVPFRPDPTAPPLVLARAEWVSLGGLTLRGVNGVSGGSAIGGEILHRFSVTLDLPHGRVLLRPNRYLGEAWVFDMSGLDLGWNADRSALVVRSIAPGTPGAEVGLRPGDLITAVDGTPASDYGLNRVRRMFHEPTTYALDVTRDGPFAVRLVLRPLL